MAREEIVIVGRFVDKMTKGLRTTRQTINKFGQTTRTVTKQFKQMEDGTRKLTKQTIQSRKVVQSATVAQKGFSGVMGMNLVQWRQYNAMGGKFKTTGGRAANTFRRMTHGLRGFRMEMLGVMFFGMGLQKFFTGLLQPALKLTGIMELWSTVLAILFLPIAMALLDFLMPFFIWIMNLSDATKMFIGKLVLLGAILGAALFLFGMFALGIGSIILAFAGLFVIIDKLIPDINVLGVNMSSFVEMGLGISLVTGGFAALKGIIGGVFDAILELDFIRDFLTKIGVKVSSTKIGFEKFRDVVSQVWTKIMDKWGKTKITIGGEELTIETWIRVFQLRWHQFVVNFKNDRKELTESFGKIRDAIISFFDVLDEKDAANALNIFAKAINAVADAIRALKDAWAGGLRPIAGMNVPIVGLNLPKLGGGQTGIPNVPHTGLYKLHAGETVNQAGDTLNSSPIINVYGSSNEDLVRQISQAVVRDLASLSRR